MQAWVHSMQGIKPNRNRKRKEKEGIILPPGMEMPIVPTNVITKKE